MKMNSQILQGDCLEVMRGMQADSVDAVVCDPPYGLEFMGKEWDKLCWDDHRNHETRSQGRTARKFKTATPRYGTDSGAIQAWHEQWATQALRVLKPGGHLLAFGGTRTYHRLVCAIEDAGFEIRDTVQWIYGSGFPKSLNVGKAIDKMAGAEREVVGSGFAGNGAIHSQTRVEQGYRKSVVDNTTYDITAPATEAAKQWDGWGTALKPAHEPIVLARKPLSASSVARNVLEHGVGAINIEDSRVDGKRWPANLLLSHSPECHPTGEVRRVKPIGSTPVKKAYKQSGMFLPHSGPTAGYKDPDGTEAVEAWECAPGCPVREMDEQSGQSDSRPGKTNHVEGKTKTYGWAKGGGIYKKGAYHSDAGGASRFFQQFDAEPGFCEICLGNAMRHSIPTDATVNGSDQILSTSPEIDTGAGFRYCAKSSRAERNKGLPDGETSTHPTVKPIALMRYLCRLITPPGGTVLDPFAGSGSTGCAAVQEGFNFIGIEKESEYCAIARRRIAYWASGQVDQPLPQRSPSPLRVSGNADKGLQDSLWDEIESRERHEDDS